MLKNPARGLPVVWDRCCDRIEKRDLKVALRLSSLDGKLCPPLIALVALTTPSAKGFLVDAYGSACRVDEMPFAEQPDKTVSPLIG